MAVDVGSAVGYLDLDISGFLAGLKSAQSEADKQSKNIATTIGNNFSGIGKKLSSAGTTLTKNVTVPLVGIGVAGLKVATDFEKGMSEVKAISGATGEGFDALRNKAIELGADTAFSAGEVAAAMTEMAKAGWSSEQIIDGMGGVLAAAAASGEGLASVSTIVADAITGFGMEAKDSTRVADLLTQAANSGTIGITDLGETFKYIAPVAGALGFSIEDVTTAVSAMSMAGIKGSAAGTSLRGTLTNLIKPTDKMEAVMDLLGISVTDSEGSMKSLDDVVANLRTSFNGLTEAEKAEYAAILAGKEGMSGLLAILNLTEEEYNAIAVSMDNAGGVAEETAAIMQDNLQSKVEQLGGALESLAIKLADYVIPYLRQLVEWLTGLVDKFTALDSETQKTILKFGAIVIAAGPVLSIFGKLTSGVGSLITTFGKIPGAASSIITWFKKVAEGAALAKAGFPALGAAASKLGVAIGSITAPIAAVVAAIAVLAAAFVNLWKTNEDFKNKIKAIWNQIKETFSGFIQGIVDRINSFGFEFESIIDVFKTLWDGLIKFLKGLWNGFCDLLAPVFEGAFQLVADIFKFVTDYILNIFDFWIAVFKGDWEGAWEAVKNTFKSIWEAIKNTLLNVLNTMKGILDAVCKWFGTTWSNTWDKIKTTLSNVMNSIKTSISNGFTSAKNTVTNIFDSIKNKITSVMNSARDAVKNAIDKIKGFFNFSWSLPKLKMPHFSISGKFSLDPPRVPKFSIEWYKKAMNNGMILNGATIFGMNNDGTLLGGGEAGSEAVVGTKSLFSMIKRAVYEAIGPLVYVSKELAKASMELGYVTYNGFTKLKEYKDSQDKRSQNDNDGGDTFIFNSPKAIDEIEAARQMKKVKKELAEGF